MSDSAHQASRIPETPRALHHAEGDTPMHAGYRYNAGGLGVRSDLVQAVLDAWAGISPSGDPALTLRSVNDDAVNSVDNLARLAATAVAQALQLATSQEETPQP
ncbi:hypothetical protein [Streptomyces sp. C]|uniref:hypothetical protein n=1 Tax=Streptomyces sp. C TaxID=253839 RepID=UPI0001DEFB61|nr:hypothetical protein [Streptomyces sp. C]EFL19905.1 predicted protein [Streptomyces sp. C]